MQDHQRQGIQEVTINIEHYSTVEFLDWMGGDEAIVQAARVSTQGGNFVESDPEEYTGLIGYLMRNRHGSPFEHGAMKFYVKAPIFVFREFHRHRIGFSYNEMSGRYKELPPNFYSPPGNRPLTQTGKPGHYVFTADAPEQSARWLAKQESDMRAFTVCWSEYQYQLKEGIPREMARTVLPVALFSEMYVTCNPRSLMSFLSLRTGREEALFHSTPQWEIEQVAQEMEKKFKEIWPLTHAAFEKAKRVAP